MSAPFAAGRAGCAGCGGAAGQRAVNGTRPHTPDNRPAYRRFFVSRFFPFFLL